MHWRDDPDIDASLVDVRRAADVLSSICYIESKGRGWHDGPDGTIQKVHVPTKLMLIVSELGEAMEGDRKSLRDDHIPEYPSLLVELADAIIRIGDLAGKLIEEGYGNIDLNTTFGEIVAAKIAYNRHRADHSKEVRNASGGKKY